MSKDKIKIPKEMTRKHLARAEREARQQQWLIIGLAVTLVLVIGLIGYGILDERVLKLRQPVATVKGVQISTGDFQKQYRFSRQQLAAQLTQLQQQRQQFGSDPQFDFITQQIDQQINSLQSEYDNPSLLAGQVMNAMVDDEVIRQEAARRNITVSPDEVQTAVEHNFNYFRVPPTATPVPTASPTPLASPTPEPTATRSITPTQTPEPTGTPEPTATPVTQEGFNTLYKNYVAKLNQAGITEADLRKLVETDLLRKKLQDAFAKEVPTTADQIQFHYISFETEEGAKAAEQQLKGGLSYQDLYKRVEAGQVVSATGGIETWTPISDVAQYFGPSISNVVTSLGVSQTSQIITDTTGVGYLIVQQDGRETRPLSPSQLQSTQQQSFQNWLDKQRTGPDVNLFNNRYVQVIPSA